jgi:hypothetical protein
MLEKYVLVRPDVHQNTMLSIFVQFMKKYALSIQLTTTEHEHAFITDEETDF